MHRFLFAVQIILGLLFGGVGSLILYCRLVSGDYRKTKEGIGDMLHDRKLQCAFACLLLGLLLMGIPALIISL